jgi:hypothetical protein
MINDVYNNQAVDIMTGQPVPGNPRTMQQTGINPQAFSNPTTIQNMFGEANQGTFTRSLGMAPPVGVEQPITPNYDLNNQ